MKSIRLPIAELIASRLVEIGLQRPELVRRLGYNNIAKGLRRLDDLCAGRFVHVQGLLAALPSALGLEPELITEAVRQTPQQLEEERETAWRVSFVPHAVILTERTRPEPLHVAAVIGVGRLLRIDFDLTAARATYVQQTLNGIKARLLRWNRNADPTLPLGSYPLPGFGKPVGFVINYTTRLSVRFDLTGRHPEIAPGGRRIQTASGTLRKFTELIDSSLGPR